MTIDGPVTPEEARIYARIIDEREAYMRQHVLDRKLRRTETPLERERGFGSALPMAFLSNMALPQRFRLDDAGMSCLHDRFRSQTLRELKKDAYRAWRRLGFPVRRGTASPELDMLARLLPAAADIAAELAALKGTNRDVDRAIARTVAAARAEVKAS